MRMGGPRKGPEKKGVRAQIDRSSSQMLPSANNYDIVEWDFKSYILVTTVDGQVYFIHQETGLIKWEFSSGAPLITSSTRVESNLKTSYALLPSIDGSLLFLSHDNERDRINIEKSTLTAKEIVQQSPFLTGDGILYRGHKISHVFGLDPKTGKLAYVIDDAMASGGTTSTSGALILPVGRTDYFVEAFDAQTGIQQFNFTYGEVNVINNHHITLSTRGEYIVDERGSLQYIDPLGNTVWRQKFEAPVAGNTIDLLSGSTKSLIRKISSSPDQDHQASSASIYVGHLVNQQQYVVAYNERVSSLPLLPEPIVAIKYDEKTQREYKVCRDLSNFECLVQFHQRKNLNQEQSIQQGVTNDFSRIHFLTQAVISLLLVILVLVYKLKRRKVIISGRNIVQKDEDGNLQVGSVKVTDEILGYGAQGTVVYSGWLGSREVAVKRMLKQFHLNAANEIKLLINSDGHPNVVRYFAKEECDEFIYLALEKCQKTLAEVVSARHKAPNMRRQREAKEFLRELSLGVWHLHSVHIIHRDLKPHNILLINELIPGTSFGRPKVSDMGLGKQLDELQSSFGKVSCAPLESSSTTRAPGSVGWQAPELLALKGGSNMERIRKTAGVDIFSLGCIFYNVMIPGKHPFGEWFERERNIVMGKSDVADLIDFPDAQDIVRLMISANPAVRPNMSQVLDHPFFWTEERALSFFMDVSDRLEKEDRNSTICKAIEKRSTRVVGQSWCNKLPTSLLEEMEQFRKYNPRSVRDCLRLIRNKRHHYHELPHSIQKILGPIPVGFYYYFTKRFPRLLMHCYEWVSTQCAHERIFHTYLGRSTKKFCDASMPITSRNLSWFLDRQTWCNDSSQSVAFNERTIQVDKPLESKVRTGICAHWMEQLECKYGERCSYAHGYIEYRIPASLRDIPWIDEFGNIRDLLGVDGNRVCFQSMKTEATAQQYKTKVCRFFMSPLGCTNEDKCRFLHPGVDDKI